MTSLSIHQSFPRSPQPPLDRRLALSVAAEPNVATTPAAVRRWSIDDEPMGCGWHDSSWMLRKGLLVIEGTPALAAMPVEWQLAWL